MEIQPIETISFDTPLDKEYKRQKHIVAKKQCRHLKGYSEQEFIDINGDTIEYYNVCDQCGQVLSDEDIKNINLTLQKYENEKFTN